MLSRKALVSGVTRLPSEPVLDADASYPLFPSVRRKPREITKASAGRLDAHARMRGKALV
jgi:hypothetical protein